MNIEYILMMSFYTLRSIVAFKSENSIKMALSRKIVRDVYVLMLRLSGPLIEPTIVLSRVGVGKMIITPGEVHVVYLETHTLNT